MKDPEGSVSVSLQPLPRYIAAQLTFRELVDDTVDLFQLVTRARRTT